MEVGRCPQCHHEGLAGEPCDSPGCRLRRYHYIPASYARSVASDDPMLGRVVAEFLVVGVVGSGGFGNVHHVVQLPLRGRPIQGALKRLRLTRGPNEGERDRHNLLARLESEADALASLSHPHIVRLLKAGLDGDTPYLVLELVTDADTLERELDYYARSGTTINDDELLAIATQTLNALEAAHAKDIVHRDVKPGNIMLRRVAGYDVFVRVLDFGLAKFIGESSETARVMGTLDYMAPEQLRGKDIGPWTDLYALGLVILAMVTGRPSYSSDRAVLVNEKLDPGFDPVRQAVGTFALDSARLAFLRTATAHDRHQRYPSLPAFRRALLDAFKPNLTRGGNSKLARTRDLSIVPPPPGKEQQAPRLAPITPIPTRRPAPPPHIWQVPVPVLTRPEVPAWGEAKRWPLLLAVDASRQARKSAPLHLFDRPAPGPGEDGQVPALHGSTVGGRGFKDTLDAADEPSE